MKGPIVNAILIAVGGILGILVGHRIPERLQKTLMSVMSLFVLFLGIQIALGVGSLLVTALSLVLGIVVGTLLHIEENLERFGAALERRFVKGETEGTLSRGAIAASLLFCTGSMAIVGALQSGLMNEHATLYTKGIVDGVFALVLVPVMGPGVGISAIPVLLYEGALTLGASMFQGLLTDAMMADLSGVGGILIMAIGCNLLELKKIPVGDLLPAVLFPVLFHLLGIS